MKNNTKRILTMSLFALITMFSVGNTFAAVNAYIKFTDSKGNVTKVDIGQDGSFTTGPMKEGRVKVQFFWDRDGSSKGAKSASLDVSATPGGATRRGISSPTGAGADREASIPSVSEIVVSYEVKSPRDVATGQSSGKRMHKPFIITKELDKSTPLLRTAVSVGTFDVDEDCDDITGAISFKDASGAKVTYDLAVGKK